MKETVLLMVLVWVRVSSADAERYRLTPEDDWFSVLGGSGLKPGDEVVLGEGVYSDGRRLQMGHRGTKDRPITVRGEAGAKVVIRRPDARQNTINMAGCQHLVLKDIEITGGDAGIRIEKSGEEMAKFLVFEGLHIHGIGGVAITANAPGNRYEGLVFRGNHIHNTGGHGEAFYLGCNNAEDGSTPGYVFHSVIEGNYIHDLKGGTVSQGDGIEIKDGSYGNTVRDNVIHDTKYPGIIVYGADGKERNVIERNVIWNTGDHGIQAAADVEIRNNIIYATGGDGIHCRDHQSAVVGNLRIVHNTVLSGSPIRIVAPAEWSGDVVVANNAVAGAMRVPAGGRVTVEGNVGGVREMYPGAGSKVVGGAAAQFVVADDFDGEARGGRADAGAYVFREGGKARWEVGPGFKGGVGR